MERDFALKYNKSLQNQLTGAFIFTTFTISVLYGVLVFNAMKYTEDDILNQRVNQEAQYYIDQYRINPDQAKLPNSIVLTSYLSTSPDLPDWLVNEPIGTRELHGREVHIGVKALPGSQQFLYIVISEFDASNLERETSKLVLILVFIGALITFIGLIIGVTLSRYLSIPFIQLTEEIEHSNEHSELPFFGYDRSDEVGALSRAFTHSTKRLRSFLEREKQFTRYTSHEFRTPITIIRNALAVLNLAEQSPDRQSRNLERIENATLDMDSLINTFLLLGRDKYSHQNSRIDISTLLNDSLEKNQLLDQANRLDITTKIDSPTTIECDPRLMSVLIDNIIRNVYSYAHTRAQIELTERKLVVKNDIDLSKSESKRKTYGMEIVQRISHFSNFRTSHVSDSKTFEVTLNFQNSEDQNALL